MEDLVVVTIILVIWGVNFLFIYFRSTTERCNRIVIHPEYLKFWRFFLYLGSVSIVNIAYQVIFGTNSLFYLFNGFFLLSVLVNSQISLPAYICKRKGITESCYCHHYKYNDKNPVIVVTITGILVFLFSDHIAFAPVYLLAFILASIGYILVSSSK